MHPLLENIGLHEATWQRYKSFFKQTLKWIIVYAGLLMLITASALALSIYNYFQVRDLRTRLEAIE